MGHANRAEREVALKAICSASKAGRAIRRRHSAVHALEPRNIPNGVWYCADDCITICFLLGEANKNCIEF